MKEPGLSAAIRSMPRSRSPHTLALLRARRERPGHCAAEKRDEFATLHSITSSVMASTPGDKVRLDLGLPLGSSCRLFRLTRPNQQSGVRGHAC
jgi:hypothetical protein